MATNAAMEKVREAIRQFLYAHPPIPLPPEDREAPEDRITKAALVPYMLHRSDDVIPLSFRFYVMRPEHRIIELGPPPLQICKGTRMKRKPVAEKVPLWKDVRWRDMNLTQKDYVMESLAETALREGIEEVGLKLDNVLGLFDAGAAYFASAKTGLKKVMWLFAAEVKQEDDFGPPDPLRAKTAERRWCTLEEFASEGREDHLRIMQTLSARLQHYYRMREK
jgi:8-oxo-dGTP pyrophosphatase MutT (NUDIX family)